MRRLRVAWLGLLYACSGGQSGSPVSEPPERVVGDSATCSATLDAPTALGLTGADLLALHGGRFAVLMQRTRLSSRTALPPTPVEVDIQASERVHRDTTRCDRVAVAVEVTFRGPELESSAFGSLAGTDEVAHVELELPSSDAGPVHVGSIDIMGERRRVQLFTEDMSWTAGER